MNTISRRRFWRDRGQWSVLEVGVPVLAFFLWAALSTNHTLPKSLANVALEPVALACALGLLAIGRVVLGQRLTPATARILFLILSAVAAVIIATLIPPLPE